MTVVPVFADLQCGYFGALLIPRRGSRRGRTRAKGARPSALIER
jgi:hypothetical protein